MKQLITVYRKESRLSQLNSEIYELVKVAETNGAIDLLAGTASMKAMKMDEESTHILMCGVVDIRIGDKITVNEDRNRVYEVTYPDNPMMRNHHLEVELKFLNDYSIE